MGKPWTSPAAVLMPSTGQNKEVAGRLAVKTNSGMLCDAVGLVSQDGKIVAGQSVFGGATIVHSAVRTGTLGIRAGAIDRWAGWRDDEVR